MKIIHLLSHTFENDEYLNYQTTRNWASRLAISINQYSNKYDNEVWYAVRNLKKTRFYIKNKISYRLFPAKTLSHALESFFGIIDCPQLFLQLSKENPTSTIVHVQGERGSILYTLLSRFSNFKIFIQYHGYGQPWWLEWFATLTIRILEKKYLKRAAHFFVIVKPVQQYLLSIGIPKENIDFQNVGIDFNKFRPMNKQSVRTKLHLPHNAFIILYIGALAKNKGVDKIINSYLKLKNKYPHMFLLFVGAKQSDPLYSLSAEYADMIVPPVKNEILPLYFNAADVYCFFGTQKTIAYGGIGTAPTEALACNINVISTNLIHLPDTIIDKVGFVPKSVAMFQNQLESLIKNSSVRFKSRDIVAPFTAFKYTTIRILKLYDKFSN